MSAPQGQPSATPFPPPPPRERNRKGCLRIALIAGAALLLLAVLLVVTGVVWWKRKGPAITAEASVGAREGARVGLAADEAQCFREATRRANGSTTVAGGFAVGAFARACLEFSRETPGFCDDVPPPSSIRRTIDWQEKRCFADAACRNVSQVVQRYCIEGRPKRTAPDTLQFGGGGERAGANVP